MDFVGLPSSTYYDHIKQKKTNNSNKKPVRTGRPTPGYSINKAGKQVIDEDINGMILNYIKGDGYAAGYHKITFYLKDDMKLVINHKKVYRLCKELDILAPQRPILQKYPRKLAKKVDVTSPNQLWELDIKYGHIATSGKFFFQASIIDVCDRSIVAYHLGLTCKAEQVVLILEEALKKRDLMGCQNKPVIRTDNGPQFVSEKFEKACEKYGMTHERIPVRTPNMNAHIESFHSILERECYAIHEFTSFAEAYREIDAFIRLYNERRKHSSLRYKSPEQFYKDFLQESLKTKSTVA